MNHYVVEGVVGHPVVGSVVRGAEEHSARPRAIAAAERAYKSGRYDVVRVVDSEGAVVYALGMASRVGGKFQLSA